MHNIDDEVDDLTEAQHQIVLGRALSRYGVKWGLNLDGDVVVTDEDIYDLDFMEDEPEFLNLMAEEYANMVTANIMKGLIKKGAIETFAKEDGQLGHKVTSLGEELVLQYQDDEEDAASAL